jgi:hypothetical protein
VTANAIPAAAPAHPRQRPLEVYLERLRRDLERQASHGMDGTDVARYEPWIWREVQRFFAGADDPPGLARSVAHALALREKVLADKARLATCGEHGSRELYTVQAELMLDTAMGTAILREMQAVVDGLVQQGALDLAKQLNGLCHEARGWVARASKSIAESERERAQRLAATLGDRAQERREVSVRACEKRLARALAEQRSRMRREARLRRRAREALAKLPSRTEVLTLVLGLALAVWLLGIHLPGNARGVVPPVTAADLPRAEVFTLVEARPPSLYLTVDGAAWERFSQDKRTLVIENVSAAIAPVGYHGIHVATEHGRPVARWLERGGVRLIDEPEADPAAEGETNVLARFNLRRHPLATSD